MKYPPGQNKRNALFFQLFLRTIVIRSDFYITDTCSITRLILKLSAIFNENSLSKVEICPMYSYSSETKNTNIDKTIVLSTIFFETNYIFGISVKFWVKWDTFFYWKMSFRFYLLFGACKSASESSKNFFCWILLNHTSVGADFSPDSKYHISFYFEAYFCL